jgi:hypothetical protein
MAAQPGFFDIDERLRELSSKGESGWRGSLILSYFAPTSRRLFLARIDPRVGGRRSLMC